MIIAKNKKKICLVIPSIQAGGMERVMSELAANFSLKKDADVHLILYGKNREIFYTLPSNITIHQPGFKFKNSIRIFSSIKTILFLRQTIKIINPISILSFGEYWNNFVMLSVLGLRIPIYLSDRSQPDKKLVFPHEFLRKVLYKRANGIIAQTSKAKDIYHALHKHNNIKVIGNPIREIIVSKDHNILKENIVLNVGRLINTKHQDKLIEIFARINLPGWKLVIIGYDHLKQENMEKLKKLIKKLNIEDRVFLEGRIDCVEPYYLSSKIFAFTSSSEGFPNAIGEALSAGLPVVAYDCVAGPSDLIINNENGFLVKLHDDASFKEKLEQLMVDEDLRNKFSSNALQNIQTFNIRSIGDSFYNFITE
jgi:glycosyltransferase involved in cell wall biosynthesis